MQQTLPDFFLAGFAKCGTTSLVEYIRDHHQIWIPENKEPRFLTFPLLSEDGYKGPGDHRPKNLAIKTYEDYLLLFKSGVINGEASTDSAFYYEFAVERIKHLFGNPRIVLMLRDPVKRAISAYSHLVREQRESLSIEDALAAEQERMNSGYECIWSYIGGSMYANAVEKFCREFEHVKIIIFEEFVRDPKQSVRSTLEFLGADPDYEFFLEQYNASGSPKSQVLNQLLIRDSIIKRALKSVFPRRQLLKIKNRLQKLNLSPIEISKETRADMYALLQAEINRLELFLGRDLPDWHRHKY